ncbi:Respiratory supercomplex factor 2, mitochondrial [Pseudocercospora fuligena]|uniref:Respiratory supercomplex factor 2, mitochondrial n=1 Tax=Pseudocercospora fuligena TaxID=685502 RepID=A0A8H6R5P3_9PEZI|nr:Respiratory supercomplex factor 2, mitochondrial [Pseudocercospora fuligena]
MKLLTEEERQEHYKATFRGGLLGGITGLSIGAAGVYLASRRYAAFRSITVAWRGYMITSAGTFGAVKAADYYSHKFEATKHPDYAYRRQVCAKQEALRDQKFLSQRAVEWANRNQYRMVFGSWIACLGTAWHLVGRNPYLTKAQKLVQARVYAQGLTVGLAVVSMILSTKHLQHAETATEAHLLDMPEQWQDMIEAEEERLDARGESSHQDLGFTSRKRKNLGHEREGYLLGDMRSRAIAQLNRWKSTQTTRTVK